MRQVTQKFLNNNFTNAVIQKVIKTKFINNYRVNVRIKKKTQHNSLYIFTKDCFGDSL